MTNCLSQISSMVEEEVDGKEFKSSLAAAQKDILTFQKTHMSELFLEFQLLAYGKKSCGRQDVWQKKMEQPPANVGRNCLN